MTPFLLHGKAGQVLALDKEQHRFGLSNSSRPARFALAHHGLGDPAKAQAHLSQKLAFTPTDQRAANLAHAMDRQL